LLCFSSNITGDLEKLKQTKVYQFAQLRICFPDGHSLSCKFHPSEKIESVKQIVQESLVEQSPPCEFNLYISPPPKVLSVDSTLFKEGLVPAARVHVSWKGTGAPESGSSYIKHELFTDGSVAFPEGQSLVGQKKDRKSTSGSSDKSASGKKGMDESALLQRMLGKKGGSLGGGKSSGSETDKAGGKGGPGQPKWFKR
jgi:hypothetical protein